MNNLTTHASGESLDYSDIVIRWGKDTPPTTVEWLWKPFIPYGKLTIIQGDGGDGKTSLILKIAAMLTQGMRPPEMRYGKLQSSESIEPEIVFYASTEEEIADSALPRFRRNGGNDKLFAYSAESARHMTLSEDDICAAIESTKARLIIIDPLQAFLPKGVSLNNISKMRPIFTALSNAALSTGAAVVLLGHVNKNEYAKDIHRGFGSADIAAAVRSIILVEADANDLTAPRTIRCIKSNFDESDFNSIRFKLDEDRRIQLLDGPGKKSITLGEAAGLYTSDGVTLFNDVSDGAHSEPTPLKKASDFLNELLDQGPVRASDVAESLVAAGISERTANRAKKKLGIKSIRINNGSYWTLPDAPSTSDLL